MGIAGTLRAQNAMKASKSWIQAAFGNVSGNLRPFSLKSNSASQESIACCCRAMSLLQGLCLLELLQGCRKRCCNCRVFMINE